MILRRILALLAVVVTVVNLHGCAPEQNSATDGGAGASGDADSGAAGAAVALPEPAPYPEPATADALELWLEERARALAGAPYRAPDTALPPALAELDYDAYRQIRYRPEEAVWQGETPFHVQLFHRASTQEDRVEVHLVEDGRVERLPFDPALFRYEDDAAHAAESASSELGWAGFRVHYPLNRPQVADEVVVFLGASYFRLLGPGHVHGLSTRGLAVDVVEGEEFPDFRAFWLVRPEAEARSLTLLALLDGPSVTGAYRFELLPGQGWGEGAGTETVMEVDARLFARRDVGKLGVAPLTSMFLHGPEAGPAHDDFRPRVHDSQGLLVATAAGEWVWRPLSNPRALRVTDFPDEEARGFGLLQRERSFERYLDLEARYHRRPSEWVEPREAWGPGRVELVEIPTVSEFNDNVVASWVPDAPFRAGDERRYRYRLRAFDDRLPGDTLARVARWRAGRDALPGEVDPGDRARRRFVVDFALPDPGRATQPRPDAVLEASTGTVSDLHVLPLPDLRGWRASFRLVPEEGRPADLRLYLHREGAVASEIWSWRHAPGGSS